MLFDQPVVYVDIETTGISASRNQIIEIALLRVEQGRVVREFSSLVNPGSSLNYWITNITGITDADVIDAPYFDDIAAEVHDILQGATFIAHNVRFDYSFIKKQLLASGYTYNPKLVCTVKLSRALYPHHQGHSLEKILTRHHIPVSSRHRAYDDAKAIKDFSELAFREHGEERFAAAVANQLRHSSLPPHLNEKSLKDVKNSTGVYVIENDRGQPTYIGKSVHVRSRLMSHFNQDIHSDKEMKISQSAHNVRVIETNTELEALLLESKMVKDLLPIHNRKLRRKKENFVLYKQTNEDGYTTLTIETLEEKHIANLQNIYGIYDAKTKAKNALQDKVRTFGLCPKLLGLEKTKSYCFQYQLKQCRGACIQQEPSVIYNLRVEIALQKSKVENWPYKTAIVIDCGGDNALVIDKWVVIGHLTKCDDTSQEFTPTEASFDLDSYRILRNYINRKKYDLLIKPYTVPALQLT